MLGGNFPSRRGYLLPLDVRGSVSYKSRVYTTRPDSLQNCRDVLYKVMGEGRPLLKGYPAHEREVHTMWELGVRRQDTQSALVVPRTRLLEAELIDLT